MPTGAAVSNIASRCCNHMGLARRFASALSISSGAGASSSSSIAAARIGPGAFSTASYSITSSSPSSSSTTTRTTIQMAAAKKNSTLFDNNNKSNNNKYSSDNFLRRTMATSNRKTIDAKNAKRLKIQQKKKKNPAAASSKGASGADDVEGSENPVAANQNNPFLQHQEWVKFQQSITVDGFQTGQTTTATVLKKSRGGKQARRKREKELARMGAFAEETAGSVSAVAQKFPAIRHSPEETEELLKQAYAALPPRAGKRGNRNLRRQNLRWKKVRKIRSDYKANLINAHHNRMEARHYKRERTKEALEAALDQREKDLAYQGMVLRRWMDVTVGEAAKSSYAPAAAAATTTTATTTTSK